MSDLAAAYQQQESALHAAQRELHALRGTQEKASLFEREMLDRQTETDIARAELSALQDEHANTLVELKIVHGQLSRLRESIGAHSTSPSLLLNIVPPLIVGVVRQNATIRSCSTKDPTR